MKEKVKFGKIVLAETPNKVCPAPSNVFLENVDENSEWFLPLLTVNLNNIKPEWTGILHFVYHEANFPDGITFKVKDNKYIYEGQYNFDEGGMSERDKKNGFVEFVEMEISSLIHSNQPEWIDEFYEKCKTIDNEIRYCNKFGSNPYWTQSDETPKDTEGNDMIFIGQIRADDYSDEVADKDLYLFYSPKYQIVTQIDQCT